jgi:hypothetical protein
MQTLSRAQAVAAGLSQYFTGKPCKAGHLAYRYSQSGTCSACIKNATRAARAEVVTAIADAGGQDPRPGNVERRGQVAELVEVRVRAYAGDDVRMLQELAAGLCTTKYPTLTRADVEVRAAATDATGGTALYRLRVPDEHVALVRQTANALLNAHSVNLAAFHERQLAAAGAFAATTAAPVVSPQAWGQR